MLVIGVDKDDTALTSGQVVVQLALSVDNAFQRTEALQVGFSHVSDQATGGLGSLGKGLDVARVACPHLDNGNLVVGIQAEQGLGHADVIIVVALGGHDMVTLSQNLAHEFLGRRFAVGASDTHDRDVETAAMLTRHVLERLQCVGHKHHQLVAMITVIDLLIAHHSDSTSLVKCLSGKLVAVKAVALEGDENAALGAVTTVGGNDRMLLIDCVKFLNIHIDVHYFAANVHKKSAFLCTFAPDF